ncbi:MAG: ATP-binding protein [Velocimicrobium sp.]
MELTERNPDTILKKIEQEKEKNKRGKLKIFFGYAAGIGKTYAMLSSAHLEKDAGTDIVAGYIEPHARPETMKLTKGLEMLPLKQVMVNGIICNEFDIDKALERKPETILVDEMAHTNAESSRHRKRYQDIEELLKVGINVYTTLNVQHIESIYDTIAGITGVTVRERIPDSIFDRANQIEMVDIQPEELITRLRQGKVYKPERVENALDNFFSIENLTSLREIALRRMADGVNFEQDLMIYNDRQISSSEHIMMCLSSSPSNAKVIRQAARMSKAFHGKFTAFYVETPDFSKMRKEDLERLRTNTRLAEKLGAKTIISYGNDIVEQITEYAKVARVTKIVLGRTYTRRTLFSMKERFSDRLAKMSPQLEIFLIPDSYDKKYVKRKSEFIFPKITATADFIVVTFILFMATLINLVFKKFGFSEANLIMVYVLGVLLSALFTRYKVSSIIYGITSILAFNFFFTEPRLTLNVYNPGYLVTFFVMFVTAMIISTLTRKVTQAAKQAAKKSYRMEILLVTSQKLQQARNIDEIAEMTAKQLGKLLSCTIYCYIGNPQENQKPIIYQSVDDTKDILQKEELAVAEWTYKNNKHAGASTTTLPGAQCLYMTVRNGDKIFAVVGIKLNKKMIPSFEESIMFAIINESALAFEKEELVRKEKEVAIRLEQEQLRANILRSISHDLRTPLTSISGNADMLLESQDRMSLEQKSKIYSDIYDDSMWLVNLVENLLSVTRIENGSMKLNMQSELVDDVISESMKHINRRAVDHDICVRQEDDMLVAKMDAKLIMQVIINLIDNAIKYTDKGSKIVLDVKKIDDEVKIEVSDNGAGIPDDQKEKIFTMFYTTNNMIADGRRGMGLGLALCKSIIEAHGGKIWVSNNKPVGTIFGFILKAEEVSLR